MKAGILASFLAGATIIPHPVFDVPAVMRRVAEERVTVLPGAPAVFQAILNHPERGNSTCRRSALPGRAQRASRPSWSSTFGSNSASKRW